MKKTTLILLTSLSLHVVIAQEMVGSVGLSFHSLSKLKDFQSQYLNNAIVPLESTQSFPSFLQYALTIRFPVASKLKLGATAHFTSTAARSTYKDYTGEVQVDQTLHCFGLSFATNFLLVEYPQGKLSLYSNIGVEFSKLTASIDVRVYQSSEHNEDIFIALAPMAELGLEYQLDLPQQFFLHFNGGIHVNKDAMLTSTKDDSEWEMVNWTGGKLLAGIGYRF